MESSKYLEEATEELYAAFSSYKLRPHVEGCPCCVSAEDERLLHARPLRHLRRDDLSLFAYKALTTWGDEDDLRHFLPRLFELAWQEGAFDLAILFGKLRLAKWDRWPQNEREAITKYLHAFWRATLAQEHDEYDVYEVEERLCAISCAIDDIEPLLEAFLNPPFTAVLLNFDAWLRSGDVLGDAFWEPDAHSRARAWLKSPNTAARLEAMFFEVSEELQPLVSRALDALNWIA